MERAAEKRGNFTKAKCVKWKGRRINWDNYSLISSSRATCGRRPARDRDLSVALRDHASRRRPRDANRLDSGASQVTSRSSRVARLFQRRKGEGLFLIKSKAFSIERKQVFFSCTTFRLGIITAKQHGAPVQRQARILARQVVEGGVLLHGRIEGSNSKPVSWRSRHAFFETRPHLLEEKGHGELESRRPDDSLLLGRLLVGRPRVPPGAIVAPKLSDR